MDFKNVCIFTMGKVGSRSCKRSLWNAGIEAEHCHVVAKDKKGRFIIPSPKKDFVITKDTFIITLVREFVGRNLSRFFHSLPYAVEERNIHPTPQAHAIHFEQTYNHSQGWEWFNNSFEPTTKLNPLEIPFDKQKGYKFLDDRIVLVRLENLNNVFPLITEKALGIRVPIKTYGVTGKPLYSETKKYISKAYINRINKSKIMKHFYTMDERKFFREKWYAKIQERT